MIFPKMSSPPESPPESFSLDFLELAFIAKRMFFSYALEFLDFLAEIYKGCISIPFLSLYLYFEKL
jgi:hypothetical protein